MAKSETNSQAAGDGKLDKPVQLTPEELANAAGGMAAQIIPVKGEGTTTTGAAGPKIPPIKSLS